MFKEHEQKGFSQMCFMRAFGFIGDSMPQMFTKTLYDKHAQITICHSVSRRGYTVMNNFYILLFLTGFFASMTILTTIQIVNGQTTDIYEDQGFYCKHEKHTPGHGMISEYEHKITCITVDDDDVFNKEKLKEMDKQFMHDLDTFDVSELLKSGPDE